MRAFAFVSCIAVLSGFAFGQSGETKPTFEIADVHVSPPVRYPYMRGPMMRSGRYEIHVATMLDLISKAYGVDSATVIGGPAWLEDDRFDVIAKGPEGTTIETAKPLLQALLAERFKLVLHNATQNMPAYGLKAGKHLQLKEADGSGDTGCKFAFPPPPPPPAPGGPPPPPPVVTNSCHNMTMAAFADTLHTQNFLSSQYLNDKLVVDQTDLKGTWNFDFKYTIRGMGGAGGSTSGFIEAFDKQLGLVLAPIETPMPVMIVDSVDQKPSANLPDIAAKLHVEPAPKEFEVATLKPTPPDFRGMRMNVQPSGQVNIAGINLKFLIEQAWQLNDDALFGTQKWMETDRYDIVAKAPVSGNQIDIEDLFAMLRALVTERFKMATHMEDRPVTAYTLKEIKPKMAKADPASRTRCKEGPASDGKDPRDKVPARARLLTCQNLTMDQLSNRLRLLAPGYIHSPVLNATELKGGYDFSLNFSPAGMPGTGGGPGPGAAAPPPGDGGASSTASDPNGAITLFEAIEKQLGLKLEASKRPVPVLVIDHAEQKPTEN